MAKKSSGLDNELSKQSIGGKARAQKLSSEQRRKIAIAAAESRWGSSVPAAEYVGELRVGELAFPCAVLSDGMRVLTETDFMTGLGMYRSGALSVRRGSADESGARMPLYLAFKNLKPFIDKHLGDVHVRPLKYRTTSGTIAHGIPAEIIPKICDVWLDARRAGVLGPRQEEIAERAEILIRGLAHVGIVALVDEVTGFQAVRAKDALAKILEQFIAKELKKWVKTFPAEFYKELFRLWGWEFREDSPAKPAFVGKLTNDIVYSRLAPGILDELKRVTPRNEKGRLKHHYHRRLSEDVGHPKLKEHLSAAIALMKAFDSWEQFKIALDRALPAYNSTLQLDLKMPEGASNR